MTFDMECTVCGRDYKVGNIYGRATCCVRCTYHRIRAYCKHGHDAGLCVRCHPHEDDKPHG